MESRKVRFGIVGCGLISKWHITTVLELDNAELIGVFDNFKEGAIKTAKEYGCRVFDTYEEMLSSDEIDVVTICTPSGLHAPLAVKAAESKKHIVVEKPMAITKEQIDELISACEKNGVKIAVISQLRFDKSIQFVKKAISDGALGEILLGNLYMKYYRDTDYFAQSKWRGTWALDGGGALMNQGIHGVDLISYLLGPVKSVYGKIQTKVHDIEVEDTAVAFVEYENGAIGTIHATTSVKPGYPRYIEINGTKGSVILEENKVKKWDVEGYDIPKDLVCEDVKTESFKNPAAFSTEFHKLQIADMIEAVLENKEPMVDMYEGKKAVKIILSIYESSKSGLKVDIGK